MLSSVGQESAVSPKCPNPLVESKRYGWRTASELLLERPKRWNCNNEEYGRSGKRYMSRVPTGEQVLALHKGFKNKYQKGNGFHFAFLCFLLAIKFMQSLKIQSKATDYTMTKVH